MAPLRGIGFTVAIYVSVLAFDDQALQEQAKLVVLLASALAGTIGVGLLAWRPATPGRLTVGR